MRQFAAIITILVLVFAVTGVCADDTATPRVTTTVKASDPGKPYTSVIIDVSGLGLLKSMSPHIRNTDGSEVWGTLPKMNEKEYSFVTKHGIVAYAKTLDEAVQNKRAGLNPMVITAVGVGGGNTFGDPIISNWDAELLKSENAKGGFLATFNVIFVYGSSGDAVARTN